MTAQRKASCIAHHCRPLTNYRVSSLQGCSDATQLAIVATYQALDPAQAQHTYIGNSNSNRGVQINAANPDTLYCCCCTALSQVCLQPLMSHPEEEIEPAYSPRAVSESDNTPAHNARASVNTANMLLFPRIARGSCCQLRSCMRLLLGLTAEANVQCCTPEVVLSVLDIIRRHEVGASVRSVGVRVWETVLQHGSMIYFCLIYFGLQLRASMSLLYY